MEEKTFETLKVTKEYVNRILSILSAVSIIIGIGFWVKGKVYIGTFIMGSITLTSIGILKPLAWYIVDVNKANTKKNKILTKSILLVLGIIYTVAANFTLYKILFTYPIIEDKLFWLYNLVIIMIVPIYLVCVYMILKELHKKYKINKKSKLLHYIRMALQTFIFIVIILLGVRTCYESEKVIDLSNIETPYSFNVCRIGNEINYDIKAIAIDGKFIADFKAELSKLKVTNIRNIDKKNFDVKYSMPQNAYILMPIYKASSGFDIQSNNFSEGYVVRLEIYEDEIILVLNLDNKRHSDSKHRLVLPKEFEEKLRKVAKGLLQ